MYEAFFSEGIILQFESKKPFYRGVIKHVNDDSILVVDIDGSSKQLIAKEELKEQKENGSLKIMAEQKHLGELSFTDLSDEEQSEVNRKYRYVKALVFNGVIKVTEKYSFGLIQKVANELDDKAPHWQTVRGWFKSYQEAGSKMKGLFPNHRKKGNKTTKIQKEVLEIINKQSKRYFQLSQPKMSTIVKNVQDKVRELNIKDPNLQLTVPSYNTIKLRVLKKPYSSIKKSRSGSRAVEAEQASSGSEIESSRILERVEIDHTQLDIHVVHDEYKTLQGRPYITVLIDHYSSMVLGFQISFECPSFASLSMACANAFLKKEEFLKQYKLEADWPAHGIPELIVADNGKEFWSDNFSGVIEEVGSILQYSLIRKANYKGRVERFFGIVNTMVLDDLPGVVRKAGKGGEGYDGRNHAKLTLTEFKQYFIYWLLNVYHHEPLTRNQMTPYELWIDSEQNLPIPEENEYELLPVLMGSDTRILNGKSIHKFDLVYESDMTLDLFRRDGKKEVKIKYNPFDLGFILVLDSLNQTYVRAYATNSSYATGLSLFEHKQIKAHAREIARIKSESPDLIASKAKLAEDREKMHERNSRRKTQVTTAKSARADKSGFTKINLVKDLEPTAITIDHIEDDDLDMEGWEVINNG